MQHRENTPQELRVFRFIIPTASKLSNLWFQLLDYVNITGLLDAESLQNDLDEVKNSTLMRDKPITLEKRQHLVW